MSWLAALDELEQEFVAFQAARTAPKQVTDPDFES